MKDQLDTLAELLRSEADAYRKSLAAPDTNDMFTLAYQWQDKKHRHVYDLCRIMENAADVLLARLPAIIEQRAEIERLRDALLEIAEQTSRQQLPITALVYSITQHALNPTGA